MTTNAIELTAEEKALVGKIDFNPSSETHDADYWKEVGEASHALMKSLMGRKAIPEIRMKVFTDADFNIGGRGRSHLQIFEKNGTRGDAIFRHPHFLRYLHYFLFGPDLRADVIAAFQRRVSDCGFVTSSDIVPLGDGARRLTRQYALDPGYASEEFFRLALESGLEINEARLVRDAVRKAR
jgi:hypothetical protein